MNGLALHAKGDRQEATEVEMHVHPVVRVVKKINRVPFTTRVRADLVEAVKKASLQRQLQGIEPNQVQEILEAALVPWPRSKDSRPCG
jgi:hypothetical protein